MEDQIHTEDWEFPLPAPASSHLRRVAPVTGATPTPLRRQFRLPAEYPVTLDELRTWYLDNADHIFGTSVKLNGPDQHIYSLKGTSMMVQQGRYGEGWEITDFNDDTNSTLFHTERDLCRHFVDLFEWKVYHAMFNRARDLQPLASETENCGRFDIAPWHPWFTVHREVSGTFPDEWGSAPARIDRILVPSKLLLSIGWQLGPVGVEIKADVLDKPGRAFNQAYDYTKAEWVVGEDTFHTPLVFLPSTFQSGGAVRNGTGGYTGTMGGTWGSILFHLGIGSYKVSPEKIELSLPVGSSERLIRVHRGIILSSLAKKPWVVKRGSR